MGSFPLPVKELKAQKSEAQQVTAVKPQAPQETIIEGERTHTCHRPQKKDLCKVEGGPTRPKIQPLSVFLSYFRAGHLEERERRWLIGQQLLCSMSSCGLGLVGSVHQQGACWWETRAVMLLSQFERVKLWLPYYLPMVPSPLCLPTRESA